MITHKIIEKKLHLSKKTEREHAFKMDWKGPILFGFGRQ